MTVKTEEPGWLYQIPPQARAGLSISDAATYLGIGRSSMYALLNEGAVRSVHVRGRHIVIRESLDTYLRSLEAASVEAAERLLNNPDNMQTPPG